MGWWGESLATRPGLIAPMTTSRKYRVTMIVTHPTITAAEIVSAFAFAPRWAKSVGTARLSPTGKALGGTYAETSVCLRISDAVIDHDETGLTRFIGDSLNKLPLATVDRVVDAGGMCFFSVGVYTDGNMMCDFDENLLRKLADHKIGLKLDIYGGSENELLVKPA